MSALLVTALVVTAAAANVAFVVILADLFGTETSQRADVTAPIAA